MCQEVLFATRLLSYLTPTCTVEQQVTLSFGMLLAVFKKISPGLRLQCTCKAYNVNRVLSFTSFMCSGIAVGKLHV